MKKQTVLLTLLLGMALAAPAFGQTLLVNTTLAAAVTSKSSTTVSLTAITGLTAGNSAIWVDQEEMYVNFVPATGTILGVTRGYGGTIAATHLVSATVFLLPTAAAGGSQSALVSVNPLGSCTRSDSRYLPIINTRTAQFTDCYGGQWVTGNSMSNGSTVPLFKVVTPNTGGTAYTSINTNGTTLAATTMYCSEADLPSNRLITGIGVLNGTTVGTDNHLVALYDSGGNLLANSATAGVVAASASTYQEIALTAKYQAVGPAKYYACLQTNGTTATVRMIVTGTQDTYLTKGVTGVTFGTVPATFTAPTTFTSVVGPYNYLY